MLRILCLISIVLLFATSVFADDIATRIETAKLRRQQTLASASAEFIRAMDIEIQRFNRLGDSNNALAVRAQKRQFETEGRHPTRSELQQQLSRYLKIRRDAASELYAVYRAAIDDYNQAKQPAQAATVKTEMDDFVAREQARLAGTVRPVGPVKPRDAKEVLPDVSRELHQGLADIVRLPTTAQRNAAHQKLVEQIDQQLQSTKLTLRCVVRDVREKPSLGTYLIHMQPFDGARDIKAATGILSTIYSSPFSQQQILQIKPGDVCLVTGTPRFTGSAIYPWNDEGLVVLEIKPEGYQNIYKTVLLDYQFMIEKQGK